MPMPWRSLQIIVLYKDPKAPFSIAANFSKAFDSLHWGIWLLTLREDGVILVYGISKENVTAIMMLYKKVNVKVRSLDGDTDYLNIVAGVLQGDTLAPYLFIICLDYVLWMSIDLMKGNGIMLAKERSNYGHWLCWWHSAFGKYTCLGWIPAT